MKFEPTHIFYHANCADGFTGAWVGRTYMSDVRRKLIKTIPLYHGQEDKIINEIDHKSSVLFIDFCPNKEILQKIHKIVENLYVIDHHKTAQADCGDLPYTFFDMNRSGASLAWDYFYWNMKGEAPVIEVDKGEYIQRVGQHPMPKLVRYVEDHDLWKFNMKESEKVRSYIKSVKMTFESWDTLHSMLERKISDIIKLGEVLLIAEDNEVEQVIEDARLENIAGYMVPVVNAHSNYSKIAKRLCEKFNSPFGAVYFDRKDGLRQWSLRSIGDFDVSEIAKLFGGGGHAKAAGFESHTPHILELEENNEN